MSSLLTVPTDKDAYLEMDHRDLRAYSEIVREHEKTMPKTREELEKRSTQEIQELLNEQKIINQFYEGVEVHIQRREQLIADAFSGKGVLIAEGPADTYLRSQYNQKDKNNMTENINLRSFQKYLTTGMKTLTDEEQRSLNLSGAAVVVPQSIYASLITDEKYSDLLYRATSFNDPRPGKIQVPIASNNNGVFHTELAPIGEASPTLTSLELGGYEIARLMQISAAAASMSAPEFESMMLNLLASEVVNGIEESVIKGTGIGEPKGLDNITWVLGTNDVAAALTVKVADIASGLSLLPSKYSKGSIILLNSKTLYALAQSESTGGSYAFNLADASEKFMGKELVVNENIADNTVYIVAPAQLYVRWSLPLQMELDKSAGFTSFSQYIRAAAVMDAKWNERACVRVKVQP